MVRCSCHSTIITNIDLTPGPTDWLSCAGGAEAAGPTLGFVQPVDLYEISLLHLLENELADLVTLANVEKLTGVQVDEHYLYLPAIMRINQSRRVHYTDAVLNGQAAARLHEPGITRWYGHRYPGWYDGPVTRLEHHFRTACEVTTGITSVGVLRHANIRIDFDESHLERQ